MLQFLAAIIVIAFGSLAFWVAEIFFLKGWTGLNWLNGFNWSAIPICFLIALACALAIQRSNAPGRPRRVLFILSTSVLFFAAFVVTRQASISLTSREFFVPADVRGSAISAPVGALVFVLLSWAITAIGVVLFANRFVALLSWWTIGAVAAAIALVPVATLLTVRIVLAPGGHSDLMQGLKMGYAVFWTALLVPLSLRWGASFSRSPRLVSPSTRKR